MQRLNNEVLIDYVPNPGGQRAFHENRYKIKYRLASGGTGAGKTIAGCFELISWLLENPGAVGYAFEPTFRLVPRILIPALNRLLGTPFYANPIIESYSKTEHHIWFKNGSQLWFGGLEDPEMAEGPNIDVIWIDEARLIRHFETAWEVTQRRIRGSVPGKYPTGAFVTTTPNAPKSKLHAFFEDPTSKDPEAQVYRMSIYENRANLPADYIESIERSHHGGLAERFIHGRFAAIGAGTIPFDATVHVIDTFNPAFLVEIVYGVDYGWTFPAVILAIGFDGDGRAIVIDEWYHARKTPQEHLSAAKAMQQLHGRGPFYCDPSALQTIEGWKAAGLDARKNEPKRDEGIREMAGRFPLAGDKKPRIYILKHCVNLIAELQIYDETKKEYDHATDCLRYGLGCKIMKTPEAAWVLR